MTRTLILVALLGAIAAPASADCYTVFQRNIIVYRSEISPIDLEGPIHTALQKRFPGGQMVISDDVKMCTYIDPSSPVDPTTGAAASAHSGGTLSAVSAPATARSAATGTASPDATAGADVGCRRGGTVTRRGEPCPDAVVVGNRVVGAQEGGVVTERARPMTRR